MKVAPVENVPTSTWDFATRWQVAQRDGQVATVVRQMPVTIDRETGERFPEPYIALMMLDGRSVHALTRTTKIQACRQITIEKYA